MDKVKLWTRRRARRDAQPKGVQVNTLELERLQADHEPLLFEEPMPGIRQDGRDDLLIVHHTGQGVP